MKKLALHSVENVVHLKSPEEVQEITLNSPALTVFTDFKTHKPSVLDGNTRALDAEEFMIKAHVKMKIIVDQHVNFLGVLSLGDLDDAQIITRIAEGIPRDEITVKDLMVQKSQLHAFSYQELEKARVQDVLEALEQEGLQHCLVVDTADDAIRGLISASDIARKLHIPLSLHRPPTFASICTAVSSHHARRAANR